MTASEQFNHAWEKRTHEILYNRALRNLSHALASVAHIDTHGQQLIALLGEGHEHSNIDALTHWVKAEYQNICLEDEAPSHVVDVLYQRLSQQLELFL